MQPDVVDMHRAATCVSMMECLYCPNACSWLELRRILGSKHADCDCGSLTFFGGYDSGCAGGGVAGPGCDQVRHDDGLVAGPQAVSFTLVHFQASHYIAILVVLTPSLLNQHVHGNQLTQHPVDIILAADGYKTAVILVSPIIRLCLDTETRSQDQTSVLGLSGM